MKARDFDYRRPRSLDEALDLLHRHGPEARVIAGGQSLVPALNMRLAAPDLLVDVGDIDELRGLRLVEHAGGRHLVVGALTRHVEIERAAIVAEHAPLLRRAIAHVAHPAVRNRGTFGGSIAHADPAAELPACALALGARMRIAGRSGQRTVAARDFFKGLHETALAPGEILVAVEIDAIGEGERSGFAELRRSNDWACVGVAVHGRPLPGRTAFERVAAAFFCVADRPVLAHRAIAVLCDPAIADADRIRLAQEALAADLAPPASLTMTSATCLHLARVLLGRVVAETAGARRSLARAG